MKSTEIDELGQWEQWPTAALDKSPGTPGIYVFRLPACFGRLRGESDIIRIGTTEKGKRTIRDRLKEHYRSRKDQWSVLGMICREHPDIQVAWKECASHMDGRIRESDLLVRYWQDHLEFPPANRRQSLATLQKLRLMVQNHSPEERKTLLAKLKATLQPG